jgi:hypothetical protein
MRIGQKVYIRDIKKATQGFRCYEDHNLGHLEYSFVMLRVDKINDKWNLYRIIGSHIERKVTFHSPSSDSIK